ncbi:MAG: cadherin-like domain-containing protein [Alphaproteobacteria bacterium]|nr:cadherin-like domain-containing protein [Alphaproteobacteria bacterium]
MGGGGGSPALVQFVSNNVVYTTTNPTSGTDAFTYTISDGNGGSASAAITVTITGTNSPPVANADSESVLDLLTVVLDPRVNDTDPNNDPLTVISATNGTNGTVTIQNGTQVTYTRTSAFPGPGSTVTDSFNYTISDGQGGTATSSVSVTLEASPACGGQGQPVCP